MKIHSGMEINLINQLGSNHLPRSTTSRQRRYKITVSGTTLGLVRTVQIRKLNKGSRRIAHGHLNHKLLITEAPSDQNDAP